MQLVLLQLNTGYMRLHLIIFSMLLLAANAKAQTSPVAQTLPYSQDFSSVTATATTYPAGWQGWTVTTAPASSFSTATPASDRSLVASSSAVTNSGNVHNYDGKIGFLNTGALDLGLVLAINTSGKKNIAVSYDVMTIRNPYDTGSNTRVNEVTLQYRIGTSGTFTTLTGIEYQNNTVKQIGSGVTTPQKPETKSITLPADCDSEAVVQLRWVSRQVSGAGSRPSFAIDNITADTAVPVFNQLNVLTTSHAQEGITPVPGTFKFSFKPATIAAISFHYSLSGIATFGTDYTMSLSGGASPASLSAASGTITVPAGTDSFIATVTPVNDALSEGLEPVTISISAASAVYTIGDSTATVNILDDESTLIHTIQGTGMTASPGSYTIEGIVTGIYSTLSPAGFYIQEEDADADTDPNSSEGIFVVSAASVATGDKVKVSGTVLESAAAPSYQQAVITATSVSVTGTALPMPSAMLIKLPLADTNDFEKYEGMLVRFADTLTVTDNYGLPRYGEVGLAAGGILYQPTQVVDINDAVATGTTASGKSNRAAVDNLLLNNKLRSILLDDGRGTIPTLPYVNTDNTLRIGSTIDSLWGIMGYAYNKYRIQPVSLGSVKITHAVRPSLPGVGSDANIRVASFNVLNYFNGDGAGGGFPTERGAHSLAEFNRQREKIINAIAEINADVVGLIEMENDGVGATSAIQDLVNGLNTKMGAGTYSIINDGATIQTYCTDAIRCGIIYKSAVVVPVGTVLSSADAIFNRPPLAQAFKLKATDSAFSFIINHFKSKSCSGSSGADADQNDGQGCYTDRRKKQAGVLASFIRTTVMPAAGTSNILSMGDYNAYFEEDPLDSLRAEGFTVLSTATHYSYLFSGMLGSLDNAFVSKSLQPAVTGVAKWNINSAEPTSLDYNDVLDDGGSDFANPWGATYTSAPFRSSDHDPVIVGLNLPVRLSIPGAEGFLFRMYPNPATDHLQIVYPQDVAAEICVVNSVGQEILRVPAVTGMGAMDIDLSGIAPGLYFVKMNIAGAATMVQKLLKK